MAGSSRQYYHSETWTVENCGSSSVNADVSKSPNNIAQVNTKQENVPPLFVGNLSPDITREEFVKILSIYGELSEVFVNSELGFGSVRMDTFENAENAKFSLDGRNVRGSILRVRFATEGAAVRVSSGTKICVENLTPVVTNELLKKAFTQFGQVKKATVIVDDNGKSKCKGIIEFGSALTALKTVKLIEESCFIITSSPQPITATLMETEIDDFGLPDRIMPKSTLFYSETKCEPRFAEPGSFEGKFASRWKAQMNVEREQRVKFEQSLKDSRDVFESQMKGCVVEYYSYRMQKALADKQKKEKREIKEEQQRVDDQPPIQTGNESVKGHQSAEDIRNEDVIEVSSTDCSEELESSSEESELVSETDMKLDEPGCSGTVPPTKRFKCPQCSKSYSHKKGLDSHLLIHDEEKRLECEVCSRIFARKDHYSKHMISHTGDKPFTCTTCDERFSRQSHLAAHQQLAHLDTKTFKCQRCPGENYFRTPAGLRNHMVVHTGEVHECSQCGKRFKHIPNLKRHEQSHLNSYECDHCEKKFDQSSQLKAHIATHIGEKPFKCGACLKCFRQKKSLLRHLEKCDAPE